MTSLEPKFDCLCAGIVVADFICAPITHVPEAGGLVMTESISLASGGCAANVALALARLGRKAAVAGRVGDDMPGRFVRGELAAGGIDTTHLEETPGTPTSGTLVINVRNQDRRFIHAFGANGLVDGSEIAADLVPKTRAFYVGGFGLMPRLAADRVVSVFKAAREAGVRTVLDVVIPDPRRCREELGQVLPWTDVFLPNADEGRLLTGLADPLEQARQFRAAGAATVVITCGSEGAVLASPTETFRAAAYPVAFVDGTGSGDAFAAGYISGMLDGAAPERCLAIGSALGASCVRRAGATTGVFTQTELDEFLSQQHLAIDRL